MGMTKCKECKAEISTKAKSCPSCGAEIPKTKLFTKIMAVVLGLWLIGFMMATLKGEDERVASSALKAKVEAAKSPEQKASEAAAAAKDEQDFQFAVLATNLVKASLKNPASFEIVQVGLVDAGALCLVYRGTNSFNAVTTENIAVTRSLKPGVWNRDCANKRMADMKRIRHAL